MPKFPELTSSRLEMLLDHDNQGRGNWPETSGPKVERRRGLRALSLPAPPVTPSFIEAGVMQVCGCSKLLQAGGSNGQA